MPHPPILPWVRELITISFEEAEASGQYYDVTRLGRSHFEWRVAHFEQHPKYEANLNGIVAIVQERGKNRWTSYVLWWNKVVPDMFKASCNVLLDSIHTEEEAKALAVKNYFRILQVKQAIEKLTEEATWTQDLEKELTRLQSQC